MTGAGVRDEHNTSERYVCDQTKNPKKLVSTCVSGHNVTVSCTDRKAFMEAQVRLIDAKSGQSVFSQAIGKDDKSYGCGNESPKDGQAMLGGLQREIVDEVMRKIVPHDRDMEVTLMDPDDRLRSPSNKERFAGAIKFAKGGRLDRACQTLREVYDQEKESIALNYDLGVCEESAGAF